MASSGNSSVYVGDLADEATEEMLQEVFASAGHIQSVKRCRETKTQKPLSYGYINFSKPEEAKFAIEHLNHLLICGKPVRLMPSQRDGTGRKSGIGNVFVKNLHPELVDNRVLHEHFKQFGAVLSAKVARDRNNISKKYGFVQFQEPDCADQAIQALNQTELFGQTLEVAQFLPAKDRASEPGKFCNIYVRNLGSHVNEGALQEAFASFGPITSTCVMSNAKGFSRGFGFVNFRNSDDAARAVAEMDGYKHGMQLWKVSQAQKREEDGAKELQSHMRRHLRVKNLPASCTEAQLHDMFQEFGDLKAARFTGVGDRRIGNVQFRNSEDAEAAIVKMHGKQVGDQGEPLHVSLAPRREYTAEVRQHGPQQRAGLSVIGAEVASPMPFAMQAVPPMIAPSYPYFQGATYFYGPPAFAMQSGQQQFMSPAAPTPPIQPSYDRMGGLVGIPGGSPFQGHALGRPGGLPAMQSLLRTDHARTGTYMSYEGQASAQATWGDHELQARSRRQRGRHGNHRQGQGMAGPIYMFDGPAFRPAPFFNMADQQSLPGTLSARSAGPSRYAQPVSPPILPGQASTQHLQPSTSHGLGDSRIQPDLIRENIRRSIEATRSMTGTQASEDLLDSDEISSIRLL